VVDANPLEIFDHGFELSQNILTCIHRSLTVHSEKRLPLTSLHGLNAPGCCLFETVLAVHLSFDLEVDFSALHPLTVRARIPYVRVDSVEPDPHVQVC